MEVVFYIAASVALLALAGLFIYLIIFFNGAKGQVASVTGSIESLVAELAGLRGSLQGTIGNLEKVVGQMEGTVQRVNAQLEEVEGIVHNVRDVTQDATDVVHGARNIVVNALGFIDNVQTSVQRPITEAAGIISALGAWLEGFRMRLGLRGSRREAPPELDNE
ncbi:MAG TPA: DUF948 domain-containing protein [Candidatus Kapabacteria bacterium]|nr:DUF948 domain-containing protein [Candidatus Kapabacteria bacterium]